MASSVKCAECGRDASRGTKRYRTDGGWLCQNCWKRVVYRPTGAEIQTNRRNKAKRRVKFAGNCEVCGARTNGTAYDRAKAPRFCVPCARRITGEMASERNHAVAEPRRQRVVELWNDGLSLREIAADIGMTARALGPMMVRMRQQGYDLPYRYRMKNKRRVAA